MKGKKELIPFVYVKGRGLFNDYGVMVNIKDPELQSKGIPKTLFNRIKKLGMIKEKHIVKEKNDE